MRSSSPRLEIQRRGVAADGQAGRRRGFGERRDRNVRRKLAVLRATRDGGRARQYRRAAGRADPGLVIMRRIRIVGSGNATFKDVQVALHLPRHRCGQAVHRPHAAAVRASGGRARADGAARRHRPGRARGLVTCTSERNGCELARQRGDHPAIIDERGALSFREFHARMTRFGNALAGLGLREATASRCWSPTSANISRPITPSWRRASCAAPLDPRSTHAEAGSAAALRRRGRVGRARIVRSGDRPAGR